MSPVAQRVRNADVDPFFDNSKSTFPSAPKGRKVPYHVGNTYLKPNGDRQDYRKSVESLTALQGHLAFFDGDCDGIIWPTDTFWAFLALGFGIFLSALATAIIHGPFSYPTIPRKGDKWSDYLPDPYMRIWIANIHRAKHGSDTESYNRRGDFQPNKFQQILDDYSSHHAKEALSFNDAALMIYERRNMMDLFGIFAFAFEWGSTYMLLWPSDGYMKVDDIHGIFDGSTFNVVAHRVKKGEKVGAFRAKDKANV